MVNKLNSIHAQYRYFEMEVIAGEEDYITTAVRRGVMYTEYLAPLMENNPGDHPKLTSKTYRANRVVLLNSISLGSTGTLVWVTNMNELSQYSNLEKWWQTSWQVSDLSQFQQLRKDVLFWVTT